MSVLEKCVHQGVDTGRHVLFNEQWERCKNCTYDLENNKRCYDYAPAFYEVQNINPESVILKIVKSDSSEEKRFIA